MKTKIKGIIAKQTQDTCALVCTAHRKLINGNWFLYVRGTSIVIIPLAVRG